jgi:hypothetical protein
VYLQTLPHGGAMGNEFFGFSPESFEQFVRALSLTVFGSGVSAFGNGPDGGREATFRGEVPYPHEAAASWNGYGVIQAKFKEKPESTQVDQEWALRLLKDELELFVSNNKRQPKPEYYVFVTNVELSSVAGGGGKDRAEQLIQAYYGKLPLKGHAVWDANQLTTFLDAHEHLRRRFREFLTPGDVLSAMLAVIERSRPNTTSILSTFLERELRADEASKLDQAGNRTDEQLRLAQLFFDLPASTQPEIAAPEEDVDSQGRLPHGVLWEMLRSAARKLDPKTLYDQETSSSGDESRKFPAQYVLLGGPGSGKSTLGQFLAQIHRAALLQRREPHLLGAQTHRIIKEIQQLCVREGLPWPATPRYPFRVDLNRFAKALASKEVKTLAGYLLSGIRSEHTLTHETLLEWVGTYPSLLILDGLDEVPSSSNREAVVKAVDDFLSETRQAGADIFIVATSRHQGYAGEFSSGVVALRHILPLSPVRALRYVEGYANSRFGDSNPQKAQEILDKLRESASRQLTAQLMGTPLQVTFMATVVAAKGDPGDDRWQLFDSYYRTIYDRERQKAVPPYDAVLSKQQFIIDRLHHDIGFWLQFRGETAEGNAVSLPIKLFEKLVDKYLSEIGREGSEKERLVELITKAARHRLVFLTSRVDGELSFDVRSLQEYMAAECLMSSGDSELVKSRLRAIAPAPYWRNVFLFAASRCFVDTRSRHLQDTIRLLCDDLNMSADPLLAATKAGSELALDILQSGAAAENPHHSRYLARIGLALLHQPYLSRDYEERPSAEHRLAAIYSDSLEAVYSDEVQLRIGQTDFKRSLGTWPLLLRLGQQGVPWADELLKRHWPSDPDHLTLLASVISSIAHLPYVTRLLEEFLQTVPPSKAFPFLFSLPRDQQFRQQSGLLGAMINLLFGYGSSEIEIALRVPGSDIQGCRFRAISPWQCTDETKEIYTAFSQMNRPHANWLPFVMARDLLDSPNRKTLARILDECADGGWGQEEDGYFLWSLPWPLAVALRSAKSGDDLRMTAKLLRGQVEGTFEDLEDLETRWVSDGVTLDELVTSTRGSCSLDTLLGKGGVPQFGSRSIQSTHYPDPFIRAICDAALEASPGEARNGLVWFLCNAGSDDGRLTQLTTPSQLKALLDVDEPRAAWWDENYVAYPKSPDATADWLEFYDWLGRSDILSQHYPLDSGDNDRKWCDTFQQGFVRSVPLHEHEHQRDGLGLLRLLGRFASSGTTMERVPSQMLDLNRFPEPRFQLAALLVCIAQPTLNVDQVERLASDAIALLAPPAEEMADDLLFRTIGHHLSRSRGLGEMVLQLRARMPMEVPFGIATCDSLLRRIVRGRSSSLQSLDELQGLELPVVDERF